MAQINPYLTFNGNCEEAFTFYNAVFGGAPPHFNRFKDMPMEGQNFPEDALQKIMHVSLPISKETALMGSDAHPMYGTVSTGQHMSISVNADTKEEADKIFNGLSAGGEVTMPIASTFWGAYFGMMIDKFGFTWMVNFDETRTN